MGKWKWMGTPLKEEALSFLFLLFLEERTWSIGSKLFLTPFRTSFAYQRSKQEVIKTVFLVNSRKRGVVTIQFK